MMTANQAAPERATQSQGADDEDAEAAALPLRMIVEWVYCPRLFHFMHVEGQMVANEHVWRGRHSHERADKPGTSAARRAVVVAKATNSAGDEGNSAGEAGADEPDDDVPIEWKEARAVDLGPLSLGVVGKLDGVLLDGAGTAIPTEMKSGSAPSADSSHVTLASGAWDADVIHVLLQVLALEAAGYVVPRGELWYRGSRTRVEVAPTEALRMEARRTIERARAAQHQAERPAPLVDSPKCKGCSLVEVCLPDESRVLREGVPPSDELDDEPMASPSVAPSRLAAGRRLVASAMETRTVIVSTAGATVRKEGEALVVTPPPAASAGKTTDADSKPPKPVRVAFDTVDALVVVGTVHVTTPTVMACLERGVAVSFHQSTGRLLGSVSAGLGNNVRLRVAQHAWANDAERSLSLAREFVRGKLKNQRVFLRRNGVLADAVADEWASLTRGIDAASDGDALRGVEGRAARLYFEAYARLLVERGGDAFTMDGRNRRPPRDPVNAMLSFGYAMVSRECAEVARRVGFDPMRGFLHGMGWGRPSLGLDLVEEFRVLLVDSTVLRLVAERRVVAVDFHKELQGVTMKPGARRTFLQALDQRREEEITHPVFGYKVTYRRAIELQARVLARVLEGEAERYVALTVR